MRLKIFDSRKLKLNLTSAPNVKLTPRSFSPHPIVSLSGSDHKRSHNSPWSGTSVGLMIRLICSIDWRSGERPPWQQKIFSSTTRAHFCVREWGKSWKKLQCVSLLHVKIEKKLCIKYTPIAATGKQLKQSVKVFQSLMLYRRLHSS